MAKIERKFLAHYLDAAIPPSGAVSYVRLGKDLEEYSPELSAQVDKTKNILGETSIVLSSYEKQGTVEPYYAEKGDMLFLRIRDIIDNQKTLDDCASTLVDVHLWEDEVAGAYPAIRWDVVIEATSDGGDNTGLQLPFTLHYTGASTKGTFNPTTKVFTPIAGSEYLASFSVSGTSSARISGAQIAVAGKSIVTDPTGIASVRLPNGTYPYTVIAAGYSNKTGSLVISSAPKFEAVALTV